MFDLKTWALLYHTTSKKKELYKRRIMVGDVLANKKVYVDLPDNYYEYCDSFGTLNHRNINPVNKIPIFQYQYMRL